MAVLSAEERNWYNTLPARPWAYTRPSTAREEAHGIRASWRHPKRKLRDWMEIPGIGWNPDVFVNWVILDGDNANPERWRECGFPEPHAIVINREGPRSGFHHVAWRLAKPIGRGARHRQGPQQFLRLVRGAMAWEYDGKAYEPYHMQTAKNPLCKSRFHTQWRTGNPILLEELAAYVDIEGWLDLPKPRGLALALQDPGARNSSLFVHVSKAAYKLTPRYKAQDDVQGLRDAIEILAVEGNANFSEPLPDYEIRSLVDSVYRFCVTHDVKGTNAAKDRGICYIEGRLRGDESTATKQAIGAERTNEVVRSKHTVSILEAEAALRATGRHPTEKLIAAATGLSVRTIRAIRNSLEN